MGIVHMEHSRIEMGSGPDQTPKDLGTAATYLIRRVQGRLWDGPTLNPYIPLTQPPAL